MKFSLARSAFVVGIVLLTTSVRAIELVSPIEGAEVDTVPDEQRQVMALSTLEKRIACFAADSAGNRKLATSANWGRANPLILTWLAAAGEIGPWKVRIGELQEAAADRIEMSDAKPGKDGLVRYVLPRANLKLGTHYRWQVSCVKSGSGWSFETEGAVERSMGGVSGVGEFWTCAEAPRWIEIEGRVKNIRDLGGRIGRNGCRVGQGLIFRGQGLNDNSPDPECRGRNRLMVEDVRYLTVELGIRTDLDLRTLDETCLMDVSPLGRDVDLVRCDFEAYRGLFTEKGKKAMAKAFRVFCNRSSYPIYVHCISGASRTGSLAYVLNGVLGVDRHDLETDWESTYYPNIPDADPNPNRWNRESHFSDGFGAYGDMDDSWCRRIELYLFDCGITEAEIAKFREIMLMDGK